MMHRPWSSIVEVPYCFSRSNVKFQGHTALKIVKFYRNWAFLDSNSSLNSLMVMKCCTKLETAKERCPIVFQSHPSNFKVTRDKTSPLLTRIGRFRTIGRSQLSNPSDLPCFKMKNSLFWLKFYRSLSLRVQLPIIISHQSFVQVMSWRRTITWNNVDHYLWRHMASLNHDHWIQQQFQCFIFVSYMDGQNVGNKVHNILVQNMAALVYLFTADRRFINLL